MRDIVHSEIDNGTIRIQRIMSCPFQEDTVCAETCALSVEFCDSSRNDDGTLVITEGRKCALAAIAEGIVKNRYTAPNQILETKHFDKDLHKIEMSTKRRVVV